MTDMQDLFKREREDWLWDARKAAKELLSRQTTITIEDVLKVCPRPSYLHRNVTGSVFKDEAFKPVGFRKSLRPISNSRVVRVWTLSEEYELPTTFRAYRRRKMEQMA